MSSQDPVISTDITKAVAHRDAAMAQLEAMDAALTEYKAQCKLAVGAMSLSPGDSRNPAEHAQVEQSGRRHSGTLALIKELDSELWMATLNRSALANIMSQRSKKQAREQVRKDPAPFCEDTVISTFRDHFANADKMEAEGLIEAFQSVSWCYKSNLPHKLGKRLVMYHGHGYSCGQRSGDSLMDIERVFCRADGRHIPPHSSSLPVMVDRHIRNNREETYQTDLFKIRTFKNGNLHLYFSRHDLVDKLNKRIAELYPRALPAKVGR